MFDELRAPFPPELISWRVGATNKEKTKGIALAYIDARDVMERLDAVAGPENWQDRYEFHGSRTVCYLSIRVNNNEWVTKADGAGDTDYEGEKGAISDALKRAAVRWGIARYLYDVPTTWVAIEPKGKSYVIPEGEKKKLRALLLRITDADQKLEQPVSKPSPDVETIIVNAQTAIANHNDVNEMRSWLADARGLWLKSGVPENERRKLVDRAAQRAKEIEQEVANEAREMMPA